MAETVPGAYKVLSKLETGHILVPHTFQGRLQACDLCSTQALCPSSSWMLCYCHLEILKF